MWRNSMYNNIDTRDFELQVPKIFEKPKTESALPLYSYVYSFLVIRRERSEIKRTYAVFTPDGSYYGTVHVIMRPADAWAQPFRIVTWEKMPDSLTVIEEPTGKCEGITAIRQPWYERHVTMGIDIFKSAMDADDSIKGLGDEK
jgi:hypothetical protein